MGEYAISEDFRHIKRATFFKHPAQVALLNGLFRLQFALTRPGEGVLQRRITVKSYDGARIPVYLFLPAGECAEPLPCIIFNHGGGFQLWIMGYQKESAMRLAKEHHCVVAMPDYRRLPRHAFPKAVEDGYAALCYLADHAEELSIDRSRIGVLGSSAGACISAAMTLMSRDRGGPAIRFQELHFPAVEGDLRTGSMEQFFDTPNWDAELNARLLRMYLRNGDLGMPAYAAPLKAESLSDLPPAYIETAEFDCFRDGGLLYAERLRKAGVHVTVNETKGTVHGYDGTADSPVTKRSMALRDDFLKKHL